MLEQSALWETKCSCVILMPECPCTVPVDFTCWNRVCSLGNKMLLCDSDGFTSWNRVCFWGNRVLLFTGCAQ